ncbi:hypothetical protein CSOJ01_04650 [Colletotrichum sojae]|uniref:Uncharacterized protein n=1 Tax=Colletotrichum sojae TaxID=2175907 RepID=A0A8H6JII8_9PEZI|nr:hypothetical protein CSOJ01_04650 [Colletotrichum sojae]
METMQASISGDTPITSGSDYMRQRREVSIHPMVHGSRPVPAQGPPMMRALRRWPPFLVPTHTTDYAPGDTPARAPTLKGGAGQTRTGAFPPTRAVAGSASDSGAGSSVSAIWSFFFSLQHAYVGPGAEDDLLRVLEVVRDLFCSESRMLSFREIGSIESLCYVLTGRLSTLQAIS